MPKYPKHQLPLLLMVFVLALALFPTLCLAMSFPNSPCDVGNGFFLFQPSRSDEGWHIYFEDKTQKSICYHIDREDGFVSSTPDYDFDEHWVFIKVDIYEPKHTSERSKRSAYFLFNKETRVMNGPHTAEEFFENAVAAGKNFDWKRGDYKDTRGFKWFVLAMLFTAFSPIFLAVLLGILGKWAYELYVYKRKKSAKDVT